MISAKDIDVTNKPMPKIGDGTAFVVDGELRAVEILDIQGCMLKVMTCDLELVWNYTVSVTTWNKQVEFLKQLDNESKM